MKVLVADKFEDSGRRGLAEIGCEVAYEPDASGDVLTERLTATRADVLVVRSTKVTRAMLGSPTRSCRGLGDGEAPPADGSLRGEPGLRLP